MDYRCTIAARPDGRWLVRHMSKEIGTVEVTGDTREQAVEKMRGELLYRLEMCPCTGEQYRDLVVDVELATDGHR